MPEDRKTARTPGSASTRREDDAPPAGQAADHAAEDVADHAADRAARQATDRAADHAGITRLVEGLVPALIARLGTLNVGELEVRQDGWRVRLQRPAGTGPAYGRRVSDRAGQRAHPGHESLGAPAPARTSPIGPPRSTPAARTAASGHR